MLQNITPALRYTIFSYITIFISFGCHDILDIKTPWPSDCYPDSECAPDAGIPETPLPRCTFDRAPDGLQQSSTIALPAQHLATVVGNVEPLGIGVFDAQDELMDIGADSLSVMSHDRRIVSAQTATYSDTSAPYLQLTANQPGTTVLAVSHGGETSEMMVTALEPEVADISLPAPQVTIKAGTVSTADVFFYHECGHWLAAPEFATTPNNAAILTARPVMTRDNRRAVVELRALQAGTTSLLISANDQRANLDVNIEPTIISSIDAPYSVTMPDTAPYRNAYLSFYVNDGNSVTRIRLIPEYVTLESSDESIVRAEHVATDGYADVIRLHPILPGNATVTITAGGATATISVEVWDADEGEDEEEEEEDEPGVEVPWESHMYLSYDDAASTLAMETLKYRLEQDIGSPASQLAREWEFMHHEAFASDESDDLGFFKISMGMMQRPSTADPTQTDYLFGAHVASPSISRPESVLTLVIDVSSSMDTSVPSIDGEPLTRLDIVKHGLRSIQETLQPGDIVNVVTFDTRAQIELEGAAYRAGESTAALLDTTAKRVATRSSLVSWNQALTMAYRVAHRNYDAAKKNRIIVMTDKQNLMINEQNNIQGFDSVLVEENMSIRDSEGIFVSGTGIGRDLREWFLGDLIELGKGGYFTLITRHDAERAFAKRLIGLIDVTARNVLFRLDYPASLVHTSNTDYSSGDPDEVLPSNFSYNTAQYFFESFQAPGSTDVGSETFKLTATYTDPGTGEQHVEVVEKSVGELLGRDHDSIRAAETIHLLMQLVKMDMSIGEVRAVLDTWGSNSSTMLADTYKDLIEDYIQNH